MSFISGLIAAVLENFVGKSTLYYLLTIPLLFLLFASLSIVIRMLILKELDMFAGSGPKQKKLTFSYNWAAFILVIVIFSSVSITFLVAIVKIVIEVKTNL